MRIDAHAVMAVRSPIPEGVIAADKSAGDPRAIRELPEADAEAES